MHIIPLEKAIIPKGMGILPLEVVIIPVENAITPIEKVLLNLFPQQSVNDLWKFHENTRLVLFSL